MRSLVAELSKVPGVMRVYRREELATLAGTDKYARRWLHMTPDDLPAVAYVTLRPYYYYQQTTYATHGSPHDYDTRVSLIFYGAPFKPGKYGEFARTVDIAPTLAAVLGVFVVSVAIGIPAIGVGLTLTVAIAVSLYAALANAHRDESTVAVLSTASSERLCPCCAYPLEGIEPEEDECTVCPECGAAWRLAKAETVA